MKKENTGRVNAQLEPKIRHAFRMLCLKRGVSMRERIRELVEADLSGNIPDKPMEMPPGYTEQ